METLSNVYYLTGGADALVLHVISSVSDFNPFKPNVQKLL